MAISVTSKQKTLQEIIDGGSTNSTGRKTGELGKDDFLNLLVTQLKYQDPLNPVDDKEFIGQMAQFSSLEQMQNMNTSMSQSQAFSLIGKHITASITDEKTNKVKTVDGDVTSVKVTNGKTFVVVMDEDVPVEKITDVTEGARASMLSNISGYTNLIGFNAKGCVYDSKTADIVGVTGVVKALQRGEHEDYAIMDGVEAEASDILAESPFVDINAKRSYLEDNKGKEISLVVVDRKNDQKVPVKAILNDYTIAEDGKITVTLDQLYVPIESISTLTPVQHP